MLGRRNGRSCSPEVQYKVTANHNRCRCVEGKSNLAPFHLGVQRLSDTQPASRLTETYPIAKDCHSYNTPCQREAAGGVNMAYPGSCIILRGSPKKIQDIPANKDIHQARPAPSKLRRCKILLRTPKPDPHAHEKQDWLEDDVQVQAVRDPSSINH